MPEPLMLAGARGARLVRTTGALELVGRSSTVGRVQELVRRAAALDSGVLLVAEAGTDVESVARELHVRSRFAAAPFVACECGGGGPGELDRMLFGTPAGMPSDLEAVAPDCALVSARGGTIFFRDIDQLAAGVQARLARVARDGEVRIGGTPVATALRLVASATTGIDADVQERRFRADLFRRLSAIRIDLPPLRERAEDVPALAVRVSDEICAGRGLPPRAFTDAALALLSSLAWPGNLAELQELVERVITATADAIIQIEHIVPALRLDRARGPFVPTGNLREARLRFERDYIAAVLQHHGWRMADAAQTLGIQRPNLYRKARQLGIPLARAAESQS